MEGRRQGVVEWGSDGVLEYWSTGVPGGGESELFFGYWLSAIGYSLDDFGLVAELGDQLFDAVYFDAWFSGVRGFDF